MIDGEVPAGDDLDLSTVELGRGPLPLESFSRELAGAVTTAASTEKVEISLGSDVLFAIDSADLTPEAQAAIDVAPQQLAGRAPGTVDVVGHTDDVDDDAHNQDLSERRAAASQRRWARASTSAPTRCSRRVAARASRWCPTRPTRTAR